MNVVADFLLLQLRICWYFLEAFYLWLVPRKPKDITGQLVLITGAGGGIGRCLAKKFAAKGAKLALWDLNQQANDETAAIVKSSGCEVRAYTCDITQYSEVQRVAALVRADLGEVDILVNNAGVMLVKDLLSLQEKDVLLTMNVNTISHFWTLKEFLPHMMSHDRGHVITVSSMAGRHGTALMTDYTASKFAVIGMTEALEREMQRFGKENIRFSIVCPMLVQTGLVSRIIDRVTYKSRFSLPALAPEDVAETVVEGMLRNKFWIFVPDFLKNTRISVELVPRKAQRAMEEFFDSSFRTNDEKKQS